MAEALDLEIAGETVRLLADRALYWPARARLLIADLHLGKGDTFRAAGIPIPSGGTAHDLTRLAALVELVHACELWILGDFPNLQSQLRHGGEHEFVGLYGVIDGVSDFFGKRTHEGAHITAVMKGRPWYLGPNSLLTYSIGQRIPPEFGPRVSAYQLSFAVAYVARRDHQSRPSHSVGGAGHHSCGDFFRIAGAH